MSRALLGIAAALPFAVYAQEPLPPAPNSAVVTVSPAGGHYSEPGIAVNPKNPNQVVVVFQGGRRVQGSANVAYSTDGGRTFTLAQNTQSPDWRVGGDVSTVFDDKGNAYLCYMGFDKLGTASYWAHDAGRNAILVERSPDGGKTWNNPPAAVKAFPKGTEPDIQFEDEPRIFADTNPKSPFAGSLYVGWVEWQLTQSIMLFSRSTDGGKTWSPPMRISTHAGLPRDDNGSLGGFVQAVGLDGAIYAIWDDGNSIAMTESHDGGSTFSPSRSVFEVAPPYIGEVPGISRVEGFPQIALDPRSGMLYIAWSDYRNGDVDVFLCASHDKGHTWSAPVRVNNDAIHNGKDQFYEWLAVDPTTGAVYVQFYDRRDDSRNHRVSFTLARSTDDGKTFKNYRWAPASFDPHGAFLGDYTWMTVLNGRAYGAWTQTTEENTTKPNASPDYKTVIVVGTAQF